MLNLRIIVVSAIFLCLCACTTLSRDDPGAFFTLAEGTISKENIAVFSDCLLDGFDKAHYALNEVAARQQRRSDSYRVETMSKAYILISADVFDDGRVKLSENSQAVLFNTTGEKETFQRCLGRYRMKA